MHNATTHTIHILPLDMCIHVHVHDLRKKKERYTNQIPRQQPFKEKLLPQVLHVHIHVHAARGSELAPG